MGLVTITHLTRQMRRIFGPPQEGKTYLREHLLES